MCVCGRGADERNKKSRANSDAIYILGDWRKEDGSVRVGLPAICICFQFHVTWWRPRMHSSTQTMPIIFVPLSLSLAFCLAYAWYAHLFVCRQTEHTSGRQRWYRQQQEKMQNVTPHGPIITKICAQQCSLGVFYGLVEFKKNWTRNGKDEDLVLHF